MWKGAALIVSMTAAAASLGAMQTALDPRAVSEAIAIGQSRVERERARFHEPFRVRVSRPPIDYVDVITPFRRIVIVAESRVRTGDRSFGQRQALQMVSAAPPQVEVRVELTFHPQNTYVGVPALGVHLRRGNGARTEADRIERTPRYTPRVDETLLILPPEVASALPPDVGQPLHGGSIAAHFDARTLDSTAAYDLVVDEGGRELARVRVDFARMR
jgi:hypothetical protein